MYNYIVFWIYYYFITRFMLFFQCTVFFFVKSIRYLCPFIILQKFPCISFILSVCLLEKIRKLYNLFCFFKFNCGSLFWSCYFFVFVNVNETLSHLFRIILYYIVLPNTFAIFLHLFP